VHNSSTTPKEIGIMKIKQLILGTSIAMVLTAIPCAQVFAADSANAATAAAPTKDTPAGTTKRSVRAENRAFSQTVQKVLFKTKGLGGSSISVFGNAKTGQVTLAGQIVSEEQDALAVDTTKKLQGVTSVSSRLTVRQKGGG
jgi:hyperosmotically inducible protein